ncbi:MAG: DnaA N-terminal domain-containing protein, partial [Anaerolineaceae bacterium]
MDEMVQAQLTSIDKNDFRQVWEVVSAQLRLEMSKPLFESYIQPLQPRGFENEVFTLSANNAFMRDWVESRLKVPITRQLEGLLNRRVTLNLELASSEAA